MRAIRRPRHTARPAIWLPLGLVWLATLVPGAARAADAEDTGLPPRFHVTPPLQRAFRELLAFSSTFRAQCQRIVDAEIRVVVEYASPWDLVPSINAISTLVRDESGRVRFVRMRLSQEARWSVLLPHELEHVVEQIEGINLSALAAARDGRAWKVAGRAFETKRAHAAGFLVDAEYRRRAPVATVAWQGGPRAASSVTGASGLQPWFALSPGVAAPRP